MVFNVCIRRGLDCIYNISGKKSREHTARMAQLATIVLNLVLWLGFTAYVTGNYDNKGLLAVFGGSADGAAELVGCDSAVAQGAINNASLPATFVDRYRACMIPDLGIPVVGGTVSYNGALRITIIAALVDLGMLAMYSFAAMKGSDFTPYRFYTGKTYPFVTRTIASCFRAVYSCCFLLVLTMLSLITLKSWEMPMSEVLTTAAGATAATGADHTLRFLSLFLCFAYAAYASVTRQTLYVAGAVTLIEAPIPKKHTNGDRGVQLKATGDVFERPDNELDAMGDFKEVFVQADERTEVSFFIRQCLLPFLCIYLLQSGGSMYEAALGDISHTNLQSLLEIVFIRLGATAILLSTTCGDLVLVYRNAGDLAIWLLTLTAQSSQGSMMGRLEWVPRLEKNKLLGRKRLTELLDIEKFVGKNSEVPETQQLLRRKVGLGRAASSAQVSSFVL